MRLIDDTVSVYSGPRITQRFREIDLFSENGPLLDLIATRYQAAGAQPLVSEPSSPERSVLVGTPPPEIGSVTLGGAATAGDVVRRSLSTSVIRLLRHDPGVRLGHRRRGRPSGPGRDPAAAQRPAHLPVAARCGLGRSAA